MPYRATGLSLICPCFMRMSDVVGTPYAQEVVAGRQYCKMQSYFQRNIPVRC